MAPRVTEYLPAPQLVHAAEPVAALYVPATQAVHVPPFGPEYPGLQTQLLDPTADCEFNGHARQVLTSSAPVVVEYLPSTQLVQAVFP